MNVFLENIGIQMETALTVTPSALAAFLISTVANAKIILLINKLPNSVIALTHTTITNK